MGFKEDADFARFVSVGAIGTAAVASYLKDEFHHKPIELERYAMANKVWQTKVKRLRLPDLVCTRCGLRVESRAKSKLKIMLSHSDTPGREWDAGGMRDDDLFAFLFVDISNDPPYCGTPFLFSTAALRASIAQVKQSAPKAASEGSEVTLTWPCWVPTKRGRFTHIDEEGRIVFSGEDGRLLRYWQWRSWFKPKFVYAKHGEFFGGDDKILAGSVEPASHPSCSGDSWDLEAALQSPDIAERYAAVKTVGVNKHRGLIDAISQISKDSSQDWRLRLEAQIALACLEPEHWIKQITDQITHPHITAEHQMEAVLAISDLPSHTAANALNEIAGKTEMPNELRAAAVWGLGQGAAAKPDMLLRYLNDTEPIVKLHAIAALDELPKHIQQTLLSWMTGTDAAQSSVAAQLLQRHSQVEALLDTCHLSYNARLWALKALGELPPPLVRSLAGNRLTPDIEQILLPMWLRQEDWLNQEGKEGLKALDIQKVRFH